MRHGFWPDCLQFQRIQFTSDMLPADILGVSVFDQRRAIIVAALDHGLKHYDKGRPVEALWWWQFSYLATWGPAASAALRALTLASGESAAFYVREGNVRTCLVRVEGPQALRHHARMGEGLPLDRGSPGRVILAFSGEPGELYEDIRQRGYHWSIGEREQGWGKCCHGGLPETSAKFRNSERRRNRRRT